MRIKNARPARKEPSRNGFRTLLRFSFEPADGVLIYDCSLVQAPDGKYLIYGPTNNRDVQLLSLAPDVRRALIDLTLEVIDDATTKKAA